MLSGLTAHTCARPATISRRTLSSHLRPCELRSGLRWGLFCSHTLVAQGLPAAQASRPPGEACGTLGRGPCSRPFPVCVRLEYFNRKNMARKIFSKENDGAQKKSRPKWGGNISQSHGTNCFKNF